MECGGRAKRRHLLRYPYPRASSIRQAIRVVKGTRGWVTFENDRSSDSFSRRLRAEGSGTSPFRSDFKIVGQAHSLQAQSVKITHLHRSRRALEPSRRAPRISGGYRYQSMLYRIAMGV